MTHMTHPITLTPPPLLHQSRSQGLLSSSFLERENPGNEVGPPLVPGEAGRYSVTSSDILGDPGAVCGVKKGFSWAKVYDVYKNGRGARPVLIFGNENPCYPTNCLWVSEDDSVTVLVPFVFENHMNWFACETFFI